MVKDCLDSRNSGRDVAELGGRNVWDGACTRDASESGTCARDLGVHVSDDGLDACRIGCNGVSHGLDAKDLGLDIDDGSFDGLHGRKDLAEPVDEARRVGYVVGEISRDLVDPVRNGSDRVGSVENEALGIGEYSVDG